MTPTECMRWLGLGESASVPEIKQAYRRLAQQLHPDKQRGDDSARERFVEVTKAYRTLLAAARAAGRGEPVGACFECRQFGPVTIAPDGHARCPECVFKPRGGRLLPMPAFIVVKCLGACALIAIATYLLVSSVNTGNSAYAAGALIAGLTALAALAYTCLSVIHCLHPRERKWQQQAQRSTPPRQRNASR